MNLWQQVERFFKVKKVEDTVTDSPLAFMPVEGGRDSALAVRGVGLMNGATKEVAIYPDFALEWIGILRLYSVFDRNVSRAVSNIVSLAQTKYEIELPDNLSKRARKQVMEELRLFEIRAEISGFIRNALYQVAYSGGLPVEAILEGKPFPKGVKRLAILLGEDILAYYDASKDEFRYKQQNRNFLANTLEIELSNTSFFYGINRQLEENPYPVPPMLAAMEDIAVQKEMLEHFKTIIRKIGLMGFLQVMVKAPKQLQGESQEAYFMRCQTYLSQITPTIQKGFANGIVAGFEDTTSFDYNASNLNFSGAEKAFETINRLLHNGLNTDGVFMNENTNTTETFARVLLQILIGNVHSIQEVVAQVLEKVFLLHLSLKGIKLEWLNIVFEAPLIGDELKDAQSEQVRIQNVLAKVKAGIITNDQAAQELGYEKAANPNATLSETPSSPITPAADNRTNPDKETNAELQQFKYDTDFKNTWLNKKAAAYQKAIIAHFQNFATSFSSEIKDYIASLAFTPNDEELITLCVDWLVRNVQELFVDASQHDINSFTQEVYEHFRKDKSIFPKDKKEEKEATNAKFFDVPESIIDFLDLRLIDYLSRSDAFYLGKFVTETATIERLSNAIRDWYAANDGEIGNSQSLEEFSSLLQEMLGLEVYQIRRIIDTTMTNARNFAHLNYLRQAGITRFRRVEVGDRLTCAHCQAADGQHFEVSRELTKVDQFVSAEPAQISSIAPFTTSINIDVFNNLTATEMQDADIGAQALHPHCRGRIVALLD